MIIRRDAVVTTPVDQVRARLKLAAPTPQTLRYLRAALGLGLSDGCEAKTRRAQDDKSPEKKNVLLSRPPLRGSANPRQKRTTAGQSSNNNDSQLSELSRSDRTKVATQAFNLALKQLAAAVKALKGNDESTAASSRTLHLQQPDQVSRDGSPSKGVREAAGSTESYGGSVEPYDWSLVIQCCHTALQWLRESNTGEVASDVNKESGLEKGALVLLDRSITLGFARHARRQLAELLQFNRKGHATKEAGLEPGIAELVLGRSDVADNRSAFNFTISLQNQALRLACLLGTKCIGPELVKSLQPDTVGSPAWIIVQGLRKQTIKPEMAGAMLRTLAVAIHKLYTLGLKSSPDHQAQNNLFELCCLSLNIRFESWAKLGQTPDPVADVWRPFHHVLKKLSGDANCLNVSSERIRRFLGSFRDLLVAAKCNSSIPLDLAETILDTLQTSDTYAELISSVEESLPTPCEWDLALQCQITTARLRTCSGDPTTILSSVRSTERSLLEGKAQLQGEVSRLLPRLAQLRKAATALLSVGRTPTQPLDQTGPPELLQKSLVCLIRACFKFLKEYLATAPKPPLETLHARDQQTFLLTFLKTVDAVLSTNHYALMQGLEQTQTACETLQDCSMETQKLQTKYCSALLQSSAGVEFNELRIRISNAFWSHYVDAIKQSRPLEEQADILQSSLRGLLELSESDQRRAYTVLKFEKLAYCYLEACKYEMATSALRKAISASISQGVLSKAVEMLLSGQSRSAWSEDSSCKAFARVITTYARTISTHPPPDNAGDTFYDDHSLPAIHRAVLIEVQLVAMLELEKNDNRCNECAAMMNLLLHLVDRTEYQMYRLRSISHILAIALRKRIPASTFILDSTLVQNLLKQEIATKETVFLLRFEQELRSLICLQLGFSTGSIPYEDLKQASMYLCEIALSCENLEKIHVLCEDVTAHIAPLWLTVQYARFNDDNPSALRVLKALEHLTNLGVIASELCLTKILVHKSNVQLQMQDTQSAKRSLAMANKTFGSKRIELLDEVEFALAYSEYHLQVLGFEECLRCLLRAKTAWERIETPTESSTVSAKLRKQGLLCKAAHVGSRLAYQQNQLPQAIVLARQSVKIAASIWPSIDSLWASAASAKSTASKEAEGDNMSLEFSKLDLSCERFSHLPSSTIHYASYSKLCFVVFHHMAVLTSHCGIYQEAAAFHEQALSIARKTSQSTREVIALSELSILHARAGQIDRARGLLQNTLQRNIRCASEYLETLTSVNQAEIYLVLGDLASAHRKLVEAKQYRNITIDDNDKALVCHGSKSKKIRPIRKTSARQRTTKPSKDKQLTDTQTSSALDRAPTLEQTNLEGRISALEAMLQLLDGDEDITTPTSTKIEDGRISVPVALGLVQSAMKLFSEDAVHSVLAETAVAMPVRYRSARKSGRVSFIQPSTTPVLVNADCRSKKPKSENGTLRTGNALLLQAYDTIQNLLDSQSARLSSVHVHTCHKILTHISLLSTSLTQPLVPSSYDLVMEITRPLDLTRLREDFLTLGEVAATQRTGMQEWPSADGISKVDMPLTLETLKEMDMDLLPASWSIVCLELNEDKNELFLARLTRELSPFVVKIPLVRPDASDGEVDELTLDSAKAELQEIIMAANATAHDGRGSLVDKSTRAAWLAERKALDQQLSTLLDNIENIWLGGFRGLLSAPRRNQGKLLDFGQRLNSTLNRQLPSRQKTSRQADSAIQLHDHVLELFIGLGDPRELELDDAVIDLLNFVIDILQFNGERNAYDEIDLDPMLIEVLDALQAYHDDKTVSEKEEHVILVLDKDLQCFPWESLPCLRGHAVSRMPSLGSIWSRLRTMKQQPHDLDAYVIPRTNGAYILNPSSDLTSTQATFENLFTGQLPSYTALINRPPAPQEFESLLKQHDLLLYFGHGGAGQYIRPRAIRKMDNCAVTLLMGCSSAKLTECGVYEPHGMPLSYLSGGSPAMVGTLWDVTDRDIDRFAVQVLEDWGLCREGEGPQAAKKGGKSKAGVKCRAGPSQTRKGPVSLDQAVAGAREACLLKYLNGAAPVMYGVPILLD